MLTESGENIMEKEPEQTPSAKKTSPFLSTKEAAFYVKL
jgi:hypothetical protein